MPDADVPYANLPIYQDELAKALGFDAGDLEMNRAGRLGPAEARLQMRRLVKAIGATIVFVAAAVGFGFLLRAVGVASVSGVELLVAIALSLVVVGLGIRFAALLTLGRRGGGCGRRRQHGGVRDASRTDRNLSRNADLVLLLVSRQQPALRSARRRIRSLDSRLAPSLLPAPFASPCRGRTGAWISRPAFLTADFHHDSCSQPCYHIS